MKKYITKQSSIKGAGKGLFTNASFKKGEVIGLAHVDDQPASEIGRNHNHNEKNPTAYSKKINNKRFIYASRNLKPGEEITTNYRMQPELEQPEDFMRKGGLHKFVNGGKSNVKFISSKDGVKTPIYKKVDIRPSKIHGNGLFTKETIKKNEPIGICHVKNKDGQLIPSTILGMYNHNKKTPNVYEINKGDHVIMMPLRDISPGEELTADYDMVPIEGLQDSSSFSVRPKKQDGGPTSPEEWGQQIKDIEGQIGNPSGWTLSDYNTLQNKLNEYKSWRENTPEGQAVIDTHNEEREYDIPLPEHLQDYTNAMMKARLAYANEFGNPAAKRMINLPDNPYQFDNGDTGTHYMASYDNYAVPQIQDQNGVLQLGDYGPESNEAIRFDSDEDANYFAENYKDVSPGFINQKKKGGSSGCPKDHVWDANTKKCVKVYTLANDQKFIDGVGNWAMQSSNPDKISSEYNDQIKHYLYSGNYGYDPVSGTLYPLKKEQRTVADAETKKILAKQDDKAAYTQSIIDAGFDPETFGKSKGTNVITGEEIYGDKSQEDIDKINKEAINNFVTEGHKQAILESPFNTAAFFTPAGMAAGVMQGAAHLLPDIYNFGKDPSWSTAGAVGMDALMMSPAAKGLSKFLGTDSGVLSNTYKINPWALKENPNVLAHRVQKPGQTEQYIIEQFNKPKVTDFIESNQPGWGRGFLTDVSDLGYYTSSRIKGTRGYNEPSEILRLEIPKKKLNELSIKNYNSQREAQGLKQYNSGKPAQEFILPIEDIIKSEKFTENNLDELYDYAYAYKNKKPHWFKGYPKVPKQLSGSSNTPIVNTKMGFDFGMDMSKYEIKNPDYFTQLLNTYDSKALSTTNKKFYKDLIKSVKNQNNIATERQYGELQRLKTGNFNFGKKGYANGGTTNDYIELDLTPEEIQKYKNGGYVVEELPEMQSGGSPSQVWYQYTGTPWSEARKKGLTDGSKEQNTELRKKILAGEFGKPKFSNEEYQNIESNYDRNIEKMVAQGKTLDQLVKQKVGTRAGLKSRFPELFKTKSRLDDFVLKNYNSSNSSSSKNKNTKSRWGNVTVESNDGKPIYRKDDYIDMVQSKNSKTKAEGLKMQAEHKKQLELEKLIAKELKKEEGLQFLPDKYVIPGSFSNSYNPSNNIPISDNTNIYRQPMSVDWSLDPKYQKNTQLFLEKKRFEDLKAKIKADMDSKIKTGPVNYDGTVETVGQYNRRKKRYDDLDLLGKMIENDPADNYWFKPTSDNGPGEFITGIGGAPKMILQAGKWLKPLWTGTKTVVKKTPQGIKYIKNSTQPFRKATVSAWNAPIPLGGRITNATAGTVTPRNLLFSYWAGDSAYNQGDSNSDVVKSQSNFINNPSWNTLGDAAFETGVNNLGFFGLRGMPFRGGKLISPENANLATIGLSSLVPKDPDPKIDTKDLLNRYNNASDDLSDLNVTDTEYNWLVKNGYVNDPNSAIVEPEISLTDPNASLVDTTSLLNKINNSSDDFVDLDVTEAELKWLIENGYVIEESN